MSMKRFRKYTILATLLLTLLLLTVQIAAAGGADPTPPAPAPVTFDSRICGRPGGSVTANTTRWTHIYSNADPTTLTGNSYPPATQVDILGRDFWGCWISVTSSAGNGWIPINATNVLEILDLPILADNSGGCVIIDNQVICDDSAGMGNSGGTTTATTGGASGVGNVGRWTDIFSAEDTSTSTGISIPPNGQVTVVSQNGAWVKITSSYGDGYIPTNALTGEKGGSSNSGNVARWTNIFSGPDTSTVTSVSIPPNGQVSIVNTSGAWVQITSQWGDGWIPLNSLN